MNKVNFPIITLSISLSITLSISVKHDKNTWGKKSEVRHSSNSQEKKGECSDKKTIVLDALGETIQRNTTKEVPSSVHGALKYMIIVINKGLK